MRKLLCAFFVLAISLTAQATTITYSDSVTGLFDLVPNRDLVIPQFDSSLGTLNSVTMDVSSAIHGSIGFENLKSFAGPGMAINVACHGYVSVGYMIMSNFIDNQTYTLSLTAYDGTLDYAGTSGTTLATYSDADTGTFNLPPGSDFSQYIGTGTVLFPIVTDAFADHFVLPANSSAIFNTTGQGSVTVTYDYTPIPEPATILLLSLGCLAFVRKPRK